MRYLWRVALVVVFIVLVIMGLKTRLYQWMTDRLTDLLDWIEAKAFA